MFNTRRCVNKVLLLLFFGLSFEFYLPIFFDCLIVNAHRHYRGSECQLIGVQSQCFFSLETLLVINYACNLTS